MYVYPSICIHMYIGMCLSLPSASVPIVSCMQHLTVPPKFFFWAFTKGSHPDSYCIFVLLLRHFVSMMSCDSVALFGTPAPLPRLFLEVPQ